MISPIDAGFLDSETHRMRVPWASDWLSVHLAAVFLSSSPGERLQTSSGRIKGEAFVTRERYEHPLEGEAGPGAGRLQSHRKQAMNTGKREPTAGPLTRTWNRRAASATAGQRPASLGWQARARSARQGAEASATVLKSNPTESLIRLLDVVRRSSSSGIWIC